MQTDAEVIVSRPGAASSLPSVYPIPAAEAARLRHIAWARLDVGYERARGNMGSLAHNDTTMPLGGAGTYERELSDIGTIRSYAGRMEGAGA